MTKARAAVTVLAVVCVGGCSGGTAGSSRTTAAPTTAAPSTAPAPSSEVVLQSTAPALPPRIDVPPEPVPATDTTTTTTSSPAWSGPCGRPATASQGYDHVIWIWMENKNSNTVYDSEQAPFTGGLATLCGTATNYVDHGIHPSLPNYLVATSGGTQGVGDDQPPAAHPLEVDNIFRQVRAVGKVAKSYQEAMPSNCALHSTNHYAVKHNPAAYYVGADDRAACERDNIPFEQFTVDLQTGLADFSLITPDICNDMHDCPVSAGDGWLQVVVGAITSSAVYREAHTAVFIVFDESQGAGTMPFFAIAPSIVPGTRVEAELDHYALLAFTEDALGITARLGGAADAPSMSDAFGL